MRAFFLTFVVTVAGLSASPAEAQAGEDGWLGPDKAMHFGVSAGLSAGGYALGAALFEDYAPRLLVGAGLALSLGIAKELVDLTGAGDASFRDLAWDLIGTSVGLLIAALLDFSVRLSRRSHRPRAIAPRFRVAF